MPALSALGIWLILITFYGAIIYGIIWLFRTLKRMSRDISEIKEMLRQRRSTPPVQE